MVRFTLMPKGEKFYDMFEMGSNNVAAAAERLVDLFDNFENQREKARAIKKLERDGDEITHRILESLHRSFVTPIDREDIALLANKLDDMLDFNEALNRLETTDPQTAQIVKLRVFAGLTVEEAAAALEIPPRSAYREWAFAQAWLFRELNSDGEELIEPL